MIIDLLQNNRIRSWNTDITKEEAVKYLNEYTVWFDDELPFPNITESLDEYDTVIYYLRDNQIVYEIERNVPELATEERRQMNMEAGLEYLTCLLESSL